MLRSRPGKLLFSLFISTPVLLFMGFVAAIVLTPLPPADNPEATEFLDVDGKPFIRRFAQDRIEIPVIEMPQHLLDAVVAVEDDRFYAHPGIDLTGIGRALIRNIQAGEVLEGGSTLTQQLVKNLYLSDERTWTRKLREAVLALKLEYRYSKKEILGMYWNTIYLGHGVYGVERAAQIYFGKSARELSLAESALLAGMPRQPEYYAPIGETLQFAVERRNLVLAKMVEQGYITEVDARDARSAVHVPPPAATLASDRTEAPYFEDYVIREINTRYPDVAKNLAKGGYRIYTTLDPKVQQAADSALEVTLKNPEVAALNSAVIDVLKAEKTEMALVAMDPTTGYIRAMRGGRSNQVDRNRVLEPRQPGSAFKPFVYASALETQKFTVTDSEVDEPAKPGEFRGATAGTEWRPENYGKKYTNTPATMRYALKESLNLVTIRWLRTLTPEPVKQLAHRMGIESSLTSDLTLALGTSAVKPLELTRAFAPFANGGYNVTPISVLRIEDRRGNVIVEQHPTKVRALDPGVAYIVTDMLKTALRPGGGNSVPARPLDARRPAAGKTGTSEGSTDVWFAGYTTDLVASVWLGNDSPVSLGDDRVTGRTVAVPVWAHFMEMAHAGKARRDWARPGNVVVQEICTLTGLRPNASCPKGHEMFLKGTAPTQTDPTVHWTEQLPELPGLPWAPPGSLPPSTPPAEAPEHQFPLPPTTPLPLPVPLRPGGM